MTGRWPPVTPGTPGGDAVARIYLDFDRQAQRLRGILRLCLAAVMTLVVLAATSPDQWPAQFALVGAYAAVSVFAWWLFAYRPQQAYRLRPLAPMAIVDVGVVCALQFLSQGSYLSLGLLAFLPFFTATQAGRRAAVLSVASIAAGAAALVTDPLLRSQVRPGSAFALLAMLALLCVVSYTVSRVQERRLASIAELTISRSVLLTDVITAEERERRSVAEAIHDGALQTLLAARQDLRQALKNPDDTASVRRAHELLGDVSRELRQASVTLHPSVLEQSGLAAALKSMARSFSERIGVPVECTARYPRRLPDDVTLFGVARELLNNVARHAHAQRVAVDLTDEGDTVSLEVRDDGVGVDPAALRRRLAEGHIGLASHRARVEALAGTMEFLPVERGTRVLVRLPVPGSRPADRPPDESAAGNDARTSPADGGAQSPGTGPDAPSNLSRAGQEAP
ncbi:sensor histidine kinase [Streptomyces wuyuanensis]|uniref:sensor histidine kinase n=1 Tax=Streptomyces wuyuanensis TaxID=1196353 RepID=UPI003428797E